MIATLSRARRDLNAQLEAKLNEGHTRTPPARTARPASNVAGPPLPFREFRGAELMWPVGRALSVQRAIPKGVGVKRHVPTGIEIRAPGGGSVMGGARREGFGAFWPTAS